MLNALRLICLIATLSSVVIWLLWSQKPELVHRIDLGLVTKYEGHYEKRLTRVLDGLEDDRALSLQHLDELVESLDEVDKRDRLGSFKRRVLELAVDLHEADGDVERALHYADLHYEFDDRDLHNAGKRGLLMLRVPERRAEAAQQVPELYRRTPEPRSIAEAHITLCATTGMHREAFRAALDTRAHVPALWDAFWDVGGGFTDETYTALEVKHETGIEYSSVLRVPGAKRLRIDMPSGCELVLDSWELTFRTQARSSVYNGADLATYFSQLRQGDGVLYAEGQVDPYIVHRVPEDFQGVERMAIEVRFRLQPLMPSALNRFRQNAEIMADVFTWLESEGRQEEAAIIKDWAEQR